MDAKIDFRTEFKKSHFERLTKLAAETESSFASLFENAVVSYLFSEGISLSRYDRSIVAQQRKDRQAAGVRDYTTALRPSQIQLLHAVAKAQKRPPKHVIEDALARFFGELTNQIEMEFEETSPQTQSGGLFSLIKNRIQTNRK